MINYQTAEKLVQQYFDTGFNKLHQDNELIVTFVMEKEYGWIFFYDSKRWIETEDFNYAIAGNMPIVIEKIDGSFHNLRFAGTLNEMIDDYEEWRR